MRNKISLLTLLFPITTFAFGFGGGCNIPNGISIQTRSHNLYICENQRVVNHFRIAIGQNGAGKHRQGDKKTPLGVYTLGAPHRSKNFNTFIPIGYPTRQQRAQGYSGRDVGIHGPLQSMTHFGRMNTAVDWTLGCVAVSGNQEIQTIASWISHHPRTQVSIT